MCAETLHFECQDDEENSECNREAADAENDDEGT
jgi:hypothetical protein